MRWMTVPYGESQSGAFLSKVRHKVASFFKKGDQSDAPADRGFPVGAAEKILPRGSTNIQLRMPATGSRFHQMLVGADASVVKRRNACPVCVWGTPKPIRVTLL